MRRKALHLSILLGVAIFVDSWPSRGVTICVYEQGTKYYSMEVKIDELCPLYINN